MKTTYYFSDFGEKFAGHSGILQLMDDLGRPLPQGLVPYRLGGGNPARVPEVEKMYRMEMERIMADGDSFERLISQYDAPQGREKFVSSIAGFLSKKYGWDVNPENIAITNGSQSAFFYLFNLFSGKFSARDGHPEMKKKILLPLVPEYIGYADQCLEPDTFVSIPAKCEFYDDNTFKYFIDFDMVESYLASHNDTGAMCVSRPTNPSGNVLTDDEIKHLASLAAKHGIPLFVDNAYGLPFPNIVFAEDATPYWDESVVLSMSLSKIGLPTLRNGIVVASPQIAKALSNLNAIVALACGSLGQAIAERCVASGELVHVAQNYVKPFYLKRSRNAMEWIRNYFYGCDYAVHRSEGAIFLWLLLKDLAIPTTELYAKLKERGVVTVPGEYFFFGMENQESHAHYNKCLRINYSGNQEEVHRGLEILSEVYKANRL